jgi:hypothetical protein
LLYDKTADIFDGASFRAARDNFGARLVHSVISRQRVCGALGVPLTEPGIIEGYTQSGWAVRTNVSRQYVNEQVIAKKIKTVKIGEHEFIVP